MQGLAVQDDLASRGREGARAPARRRARNVDVRPLRTVERPGVERFPLVGPLPLSPTITTVPGTSPSPDRRLPEEELPEEDPPEEELPDDEPPEGRSSRRRASPTRAPQTKTRYQTTSRWTPTRTCAIRPVRACASEILRDLATRATSSPAPPRRRSKPPHTKSVSTSATSLFVLSAGVVLSKAVPSCTIHFSSDPSVLATAAGVLSDDAG